MAPPYVLHIIKGGASRECKGRFEIVLNPEFEFGSWTPKQIFDFVQWFLNDPPNERHDGDDDDHLIEFVKARRLVRLCKDGHELFAHMVLDSGSSNDIMAVGAG